MARGSSPDSLTGFVNIFKPCDMTSSDAVCIVRGVLSRLIGGRQKTGHLGTLDPLACGVLPIALGKATALFDLLAFKTKRYIARFTFGASTDTLDRGGSLTADGGRIPTAEEINAVLPKFIGDIMQVPPVYSAKSVDGKRAYAYARSGVQPELPARKVTVHSVTLIKEEESGTFAFDIVCGGGTYIRALARDIAAALGTCAYMSRLTRVASGPFLVEDSVTIGEFRDHPEKYLLPVEFGISDKPKVILDDADSKRILNGVPVKTDIECASAAVYAQNGTLLGIGSVSENGLKLKVRL